MTTGWTRAESRVRIKDETKDILPSSFLIHSALFSGVSGSAENFGKREFKREQMKTLLLPSLLVCVSFCAFAQPSQKEQKSISNRNDPLIECQLTRQSDGMFAGKCLQPGGIEIPGTVAAGETFQLRLAPPATNEANLWRGTVGTDKDRLSPVGVDQSGAFRWMRYWAELTVVQVNADTFQFSFNPASSVTPTKDDLEILRRARKYFDDPAHWSHQPDPDVYAAATAFAKDPSLSRRGFCPTMGPRTLFCALYHASIEQTGEFWWGRPAVNAVRAAVTGDDASDKLRHPLMEFNGAAETKLADVQRIFDVAIAYVKERRNCGVQNWIWGGPVSKKCQ